MTRDMIQVISALRWRNGSTRRSDTSVTKIAYSSVSLAVAFGLGAGIWLRNFGALASRLHCLPLYRGGCGMLKRHTFKITDFSDYIH